MDKKPILKIGYLPIMDHLILGVAKEKYLDELKNIEMSKFTNWNDLADSLRKGHVDGAFILAPLAMKLRREGVPIENLLLANREGSVLTVKKSINNISQLKGKTIAIPHKFSPHNFILHSLLTKEGLDYNKDTKIIEMSPPEMPNELSKNKIDAYIVAEPFGSVAVKENVGKILVDTGIVKSHHMDCIFVLRGSIIKKHHQLVRNLVQKLILAGILIYENPEEVAPIGANFLNQDQKLITDILFKGEEKKITTWDLIPLKQEFSDLEEYAINDMKIQKEKLNLDKFIDDSISKDIYEEIYHEKEKKEKLRRTIERIGYPILIIGLVLGLWQLISFLNIFSEMLLPSPISVGFAIVELWKLGLLWQNVLISLYRVFAGFFIALVIAVPLGLMFGTFKGLNEAFDPLIQILRPMSPIAWIPLAILWFGIGNKPSIFIIFISAFFPLLIYTISAGQNINPIIIKSAQNFGLERFALLRRVILPASAPQIMTGARIGLGIGWFIIVAAEMVGMKSGIGFLILHSRNFLRTDWIIAGMIIIGIVGLIIDKMMSYFEHKIREKRGLQ